MIFLTEHSATRCDKLNHLKKLSALFINFDQFFHISCMGDVQKKHQ